MSDKSLHSVDKENSNESAKNKALEKWKYTTNEVNTSKVKSVLSSILFKNFINLLIIPIYLTNFLLILKIKYLFNNDIFSDFSLLKLILLDAPISTIILPTLKFSRAVTSCFIFLLKKLNLLQ